MTDRETAAKLADDLATLKADLALIESDPNHDPKVAENYRLVMRNLRALILSYGGNPDA